MKTRPSHDDPFDAFAEQAYPRLLRLITPMLRSRHEAEDVVQESLMAVWKRRELVDDWAAYAARACWLNAIKRKQRKKEWVELGEEHMPARMPSADALELEQAIERLPAAQQAVIRLRFYAGASFHEIGESLEISMNTASSRVRYALKALRGALRFDGGNDGK